MLLVCDVGNTNIVFGLYKDKELMTSFRMGTDPSKTSDEYGIVVKNIIEDSGFNFCEIENIIISSVVPEVMHSLENFALKFCKEPPLIVGPGIKTGINIKYLDPSQVGADRIVNAVAAYEKYGGPLIIIDFGTATTFCVISEKGDYLGGAISPGVKISAEALFQNASKLPRVEIVKPDYVIGKTTIGSMQSGIYYGYVGLLDKIIDKIKEEYEKDDIRVIATGGLAQLIVEESNHDITVDKTLTLEGLRIIHEKNIMGRSKN